MEQIGQNQLKLTKIPDWTYGVMLTVLIATIGKFLGELVPLVGAILFAIMIGIVIKNTFGVHQVFEPGLNITIKKLLKFSVVLLGMSLNLSDILKIGQQSFLVVLLSVCLGILLTIAFGKMLKLDKTIALLIGVGTSICGATAITCVKGVIDAKENETAYAISTIVFFNLIAFFVYPVVGHVFHFTPLEFGIWTGTAVHDTSSAVAVGYVYGNEAGEIATTVKLARTLFLLPLILLIPLFMKTNGNRKDSLRKAFPWFIIWFLFVSIVNTLGLIPNSLRVLGNDAAKFIIVMVMAAVGLQVNIKQFAKLGFKPFLTGLFASITVSIVSLVIIMFLF